MCLLTYLIPPMYCLKTALKAGVLSAFSWKLVQNLCHTWLEFFVSQCKFIRGRFTPLVLVAMLPIAGIAPSFLLIPSTLGVSECSKRIPSLPYFCYV